MTEKLKGTSGPYTVGRGGRWFPSQAELVPHSQQILETLEGLRAPATGNGTF